MRIPFLLIAVLAGCAEDALSAKEGAASDTAGGDFDSGTMDDTGPPPPAAEPEWFGLSALLPVAAAQPVTKGVTVSLTVEADPPGEPLCEVTPNLFGVAGGVPPDPSIAVWWEMSLVAASPCATLPGRLELGIGTLHPEVRARLGALDLDGVADSLFGAYARVDGGEVYAFGYAGTEAALSGAEPARLPPPDGTYTVVPVYLLALPAQP